ncbi:MAG: hypothetical protein WC227_00315 [Patescibacteria group bacterium]
MIIIINTFLSILVLLFNRWKLWKKIISGELEHQKKYTVDWRDYATIIAFASVILITVVANPLAQDADGYLTQLTRSIAQNINLEPRRQFYISFLGVCAKFLRIDVLFLYRNVFIALFLGLSLIFYDYLRKNIHPRFTAILLYMSLLAPSVILTEMNIIRPQVGMMVLTIPVLILTAASVKTNNALASIVAFTISVFSMKFHELGICLVMISSLALVINLSQLIFVDKKIPFKYVILAILIILPYIELFHLGQIFAGATFMIKYALHFFDSVHWRWWFINNYQTMDGAELGWTGIYALFYYLYNGILSLLLAVYLSVFLLKKRIKVRPYIVLPLVYILLFFLVAEVLPRLGLFFLPNRAWVHLSIGVVIMTAMLIERCQQLGEKNKLLNIALMIFIIMGSAASLYVSINNVSIVYKEELAVARYIKNHTPANSIIFSTQGNATLIDLYSNRYYHQLIFDHRVDRLEFDNILDKNLRNLASNTPIVIQPELKQQITTLEDDTVVSTRTVLLKNRIIENPKIQYDDKTAVYFLYSYKKLSGLNAKRSYQQNSDDILNREIYSALGYPIVYADNGGILIKIR